MKTLRVRITLMEMALGTACNDQDVYTKFIKSKAPEGKDNDDEVDALPEVEEKMTVFPRDDDGNPMFWDYQIKGFFKDSCSALQRCKGEDFSKASCSLKAYKKVIDGCIMVYPRKIKIDMHGGEMGTLQRPLRAQTAQGERTALAMSETVPEGSTIDLEIECLSDDYEKPVREWLDYGRFKGLGQWRNAGFGRMLWEELDDEGNVIGGNKR